LSKDEKKCGTITGKVTQQQKRRISTMKDCTMTEECYRMKESGMMYEERRDLERHRRRKQGNSDGLFRWIPPTHQTWNPSNNMEPIKQHGTHQTTWNPSKIVEGGSFSYTWGEAKNPMISSR